MGTSRLFLFRVWILVLIGISACESSDSVKSEEASEISPDLGMVEEMRTQIDLGLAQKSGWQKHWAAQIGSFDSQNFELFALDSIDPLEMPEKNPILEGDPLFPYQIPHPEGNGTMDIYSYKVEAQDGLDHPFLNPDSEVIWYRSDGMKERLLFMGPSGMFEEGMWMSASKFLVLGFLQEEQGFRPMAWMLDLDSHQLYQFRLDQLVRDYSYESYLDLKLKSVDLTTDGV